MLLSTYFALAFGSSRVSFATLEGTYFVIILLKYYLISDVSSQFVVYRIWKKIYNGRDSSEDLRENIDMLSNDFPLTRLLASLDLVVAYSNEFINELSSSPKLKGKQKRYALILKSASPDAKAEIERYFSSVVEDVLTVHQVSV